jgi:hypothetical protein
MNGENIPGFAILCAILNYQSTVAVQICARPSANMENSYKSRFWPDLNGVIEDSFVPAHHQTRVDDQSDREIILLDVIGAYDLLLLQGLTPEKAVQRLGLSRSRDDLVQELDKETERRLSNAPPSP